ncbi:MAG: GTPase [Deltaproteobacteria bacterium]|nr:GTPase [Deltaproteobacteria bacterium]
MADSSSDPARRDASDALNDLEAVLARIPGLGQLTQDFRALRALIIENRPPRIAAMGRRGCGKSSIANALLGSEALTTGAVEDTTKSPAWVTIEHEGRRLRWMDTPGLRAGGQPDRGEQVAEMLANEAPDVLLFCVRATQVDSAIDDDIADLRSALAAIETRTKTRPPVIAVITRVDELPPPIPKQPPFTEAKRESIQQATNVLKAHLERSGVVTQSIHGVSAYAKYFADGSLAIDWRHNVDQLAVALFDALPMAAQADAAVAFEASRTLRRRVARRIVTGTTSIAFFVAAAPLPHDLVLLTPLQGVMVLGISFLADRNSRARMVAEWTAGMGINLGAGVAMRAAARSLIKLVPGFGSAIAGSVAAAGTWALGSAATRYFVDGATIDETRTEFDAIKRTGFSREALSAIGKPEGSHNEEPHPEDPSPENGTENGSS